MKVSSKVKQTTGKKDVVRKIYVKFGCYYLIFLPCNCEFYSWQK